MSDNLIIVICQMLIGFTVASNQQYVFFIHNTRFRDGRIKVIGGDNIEGLLISPKLLPFKYLEVGFMAWDDLKILSLNIFYQSSRHLKMAFALVI